MDLDWLRDVGQSILKDWLKVAIVAVVAGFIAWAKSKDWRWATPFLYGLVAFAALSVVLVSWSLRPQLSATNPNIEPTVRTWLDNFHSIVQKEARTDVYFSFLIHTKNRSTD